MKKILTNKITSTLYCLIFQKFYSFKFYIESMMELEIIFVCEERS